MDLFGDITISPTERKETRIAERRRKAKLVYEKTAESWKRATYDYAVNVFLPEHETFLFEDISLGYAEYAKRYSKPVTASGRAFAGLQARLVREGRIEATTATGTRTNGQVGPIYRRVR